MGGIVNRNRALLVNDYGGILYRTLFGQPSFGANLGMFLMVGMLPICIPHHKYFFLFISK